MPKAPKISAERVKQVLDYDPDTGIFRWKEKTAKWTLIGAEAGVKPSHHGYKIISLDKGDYLAQRLAWAIMTGSFSEYPITFKDGNRLNLKWDNLTEKKILHKAKFDHSTKEGKSAYAKEWRVLHGDKYKDRSLKSDFGITIKDYERMMIEQNGCCAICKKPETATRKGIPITMSVDHNHATGQIRSLLCRKCNVGLGSFRDSAAILRDAANYLEYHESKEQQDNIIPLHSKGAK